MKSILGFLIAALFCCVAEGRELSCIPRAELGETTAGEHMYERDADLQIKNLSRINLDELTVTSAEGQTGRIVRIEENLYRTANPDSPYYFIMSDSGAIVVELSVLDPATYIKVLMCK